MTIRRVQLLALSLCLLLSLCACAQTAQPDGAQSVTAAKSAAQAPKQEPETFLIQYPGFVDQYFDAEHHVLVLENSEKNQVDFQFELTDRKGSVLFQSEAVKPGEETGWDVSERWRQNDHELTITSTPVYEDGSLGNPVSQTITVNVELDEE